MGLEAGENIVKALNKSLTYLGVLEFSSTNRVIHAMDNNLAKASEDLVRAKNQKLDGGTNTTGALQEAQRMLNSTGRSDAAKLVFLFTDGCPNDQNSAVEAGRSLRAAVRY